MSIPDFRRPASASGSEPRRSRRHRKHRSPLQTLLKVAGTLLLVGLTTGVLLACFAAVYVKSVIIPMTPLDLNNFNAGLNSVLYYTDDAGQHHELRTLHGDENRIWVTYDEIPKDLINATVAIEDQRFWTHSGVDWKRTAAAVLYMFTGQDIQGGSTITQQLIKNITTYNDTTVKRKVVEIFRALEFTKNYSKETTLEWYLNYIYLGRDCDGVYTAAYKYFGKPLSQLTTAECASLISITNNPSLYDPYTNPENNLKRKNLVLRAMYEQEYLTKEEYEAAKAQELVFTSRAVENPANDDNPEIYSWYEEQVITDVAADLAKELGVEYSIAYNMVLSGGLSIYTCVDPEIQGIVNDIYSDQSNFPWDSSTGQQLQSAITVIDNETGDVVAIAGQVGNKTGNRWRNNASAAARQPGSSFKPLSVYAPAIELGLVTPASIVDDYPYELNGDAPYPVNSGSAKYEGLTTVYEGLTHSVNTIAFRILSDMVTPPESFRFVEERFKIDLVEGTEVNGKFSSDLDRAPLSMGGLTKGVNTRDMAEAFAVFPNQGIYTPSRTYTKVLDADGQVLLENTSSSEVVLKDTTAYYMNTMLQNVVANGTGYEARLDNMHVAGKTGSSTSDRDRWFAGYTPYYTAVVWTGYEVPERVRSSGRNPASVAFNKVMSRVHKGLADKDFFTINNLVTTEYCLDSGLLPTDACRSDVRGSRVRTMTLLRDDAPTTYCTRHSPTAAVTVCLDCPVLNSDGTPTGLYHPAGPYCPADRQSVVSLLDYTRTPVGSAVAADEPYTLAHTQSLGPCTVHTTAPELPPAVEDPGVIDPDDPNWSGNVTGGPEVSAPDASQPGGEPTVPPDSGILPEPVVPDPSEPYVPA
ncbi:MAG: transglycosylase domain-containing protein [Oscillospiraceae bacterium]|nr:transglycosylase domain-containing protein [Oscillospiraceae bacterium]